MPDTPPDEVVLRLPATAEERTALRAALLAARATELSELQRRGGRLAYGYGSESARDDMSAEVRRLRLRHEMLDRLVRALEQR
jgi:hypothetical protein